MDGESPLRKHRNSRGLTLELVAERVGLSVSQLSRIERSERDAKLSELLALADLYKVPVQSLVDSAPVLVVGYVSAGAEAVLFSEGQGNIEEVERPPGAGKDTVAVVVRGDSMAGVADNNWLLYYHDVHTPPTAELYGQLCIVGLADGRIVVKKLIPGRRPNRFHLYSTNATVMTDQEVAWAARVEWIRPR